MRIAPGEAFYPPVDEIIPLTFFEKSVIKIENDECKIMGNSIKWKVPQKWGRGNRE